MAEVAEIPAGLDLKPVATAKPEKAKKGKTGKSRGFSLFDLTDDKFKHDLLDAAMERLEAKGLSSEEAMAAALEQVDSLTKDKVIAYALRIRQWEAEAEVIKKLEDAQKKRRDRREKLAEGLRTRLVFLMERDGRLSEKFEGEEADVSFRSFPKVEVLNWDELPPEYKESTTPAPVLELKDKAQLKRAALASREKYFEAVTGYVEGGMAVSEAEAKAKDLLIPGVKIDDNWKVSIK